MHEVGLMQQAVDIALRHAEEAGAGRIRSFTLRVGALSGVAPDSLALAFAVTTRGTIAEQAQLEIQDEPIRCRCAACAEEFSPHSAVYACPACGRISTDIRAGRDLAVVSIEVD